MRILSLSFMALKSVWTVGDQREGPYGAGVMRGHAKPASLKGEEGAI